MAKYFVQKDLGPFVTDYKKGVFDIQSVLDILLKKQKLLS